MIFTLQHIEKLITSEYTYLRTIQVLSETFFATDHDNDVNISWDNLCACKFSMVSVKILL